MGKKPKYNRNALLQAAVSLEVQRSALRDQREVATDELERSASAVHSQVYEGGVARRVPRRVQAAVQRAARLIAERTLEDQPVQNAQTSLPEQRVGVYATAGEVAWLGRFGMFDEEEQTITIESYPARHLAEGRPQTFDGINLGDQTVYLQTS